MVQENVSLLTLLGEKIGRYGMSSQSPCASVVLLDIREHSFSSCVITAEDSSFRLADFQEGCSHQLTRLYKESEALSDTNYAWWKLCFYHDGKRFHFDEYYRSLPITEESLSDIGTFADGHSELLAPFSFLSGRTVVVVGTYSRALPFLYALQEELSCTLHFVNDLLPASSLGADTAQTMYIPATAFCLQSTTAWGLTVNELIPGARSVEENCLTPTYSVSPKAHYILLQLWIETANWQEFYLCTKHTDSSIQKLSLWKH